MFNIKKLHFVSVRVKNMYFKIILNYRHFSSRRISENDYPGGWHRVEWENIKPPLRTNRPFSWTRAFETAPAQTTADKRNYIRHNRDCAKWVFGGNDKTEGIMWREKHILSVSSCYSGVPFALR